MYLHSPVFNVNHAIELIQIEKSVNKPFKLEICIKQIEM